MFNSLTVWNEYVLALLLLSDTSKMPLQRGIMAFSSSHSVDYPVYMAGLTITVIPIILFYLAMQKIIHKGLFSKALTG